jgi:hypothetical protein
LDDEANWTKACRHHHSQADTGWLRYELPESAREFAREYDLERFLPESLAPNPERGDTDDLPA